VFCSKFFLFFSFTAEANQNATKMVIDAVVADHGGNENCPWSVAELKGMYELCSCLK